MTPSPLHAKLRVDDLRFLLAVADTGRLVSAADHLNVDHSTVSRRIRALERALGTKLVLRGVDGWELTEFGRTVATQARPIEDALKGVLRAADGRTADAVSGSFRITAPDAFATAFLVPALARLREQHPDLTIELITAVRQLSLHPSGFDLAVAVGDSTARQLVTEKLCDYRLGLYATAEYLRRFGRPHSHADLQQHTIVFYVDSHLQVGDLHLAQHLPGVEARFTSTNIFAQLEATSSGAGIGLLPRFMALRAPDLHELTEVGVDVRLTYTLAARREGISRPAFQEVRRVIHQEVRRRRHELTGLPDTT